ncbi:MAG: LuxR C-terminal-related transcriptional regulator [Anaerolineae bacterium]
MGLAHKLILVSAPAGYGKTTVLGQWLDDCSYPSAWLSLDAGDSELAVFLTYFTGVIQTVYPDACPQISSLLQSHQMPPAEYLANTLTNELADLPDRLLLVLDDFHRIEGEAVPQLVTSLLDHLPAQVCLVIAARQDPDLPLVRLRAGGEMVELRMADLCFTVEEVQNFLEQAVGAELSDETVNVLERRTEGWVVGLRLAALSLRGAKDPSAFVQAFQVSGHRYVMEYLVGEVLSQQPPAIQDFLLQTSILDRFCAPLCDAALDRQDSEVILEELDRANLFLVALDFEGKWHRYHHLFQELLAHRLQARTPGEDIASLHAKASAWFARNGLIEEAMTHALAAGDATGAARLVEGNYRQAINRSQWTRLKRWVELLPESVIEQRPGSLLAQCWCLHRAFKLEATVPLFAAAAAFLEDPEASAELDIDEAEQRYLLGEINGLRSQALFFLGGFESGLAYAEESMAQLPRSFPYGHSGALLYWALHAHALGRGEEATGRLHETIRTEPGSSPFTMHLYNGLCYNYRSNADFSRLLRSANDYLNFALKANLRESEAFAHYHLGVLHYEWNELATARQHFEAAINLRYHAHELSLHFSLLGLALVHLAQDRLGEAQASFAAAREFAQGTESELLLASSRSFQARLLLLQEDPERADRESLAAYDGSQVEPMLLLEVPALTRAKVLVARATPESLRQATALLDELLAHAESTHYTWRQIEILALQTLSLAAQDHIDEALSRLEQAVTLARPGRLVRTFVDLGPALADLLDQLCLDSKAPDYIAQILGAYRTRDPSRALRAGEGLRIDTQDPLSVSRPSFPPARDTTGRLIEPLTERELEVLVLLGERLTNPEIAQRLVISPHTAKRHASNIYQKLNVSNRRQAAAKAQSLGILPPA